MKRSIIFSILLISLLSVSGIFIMFIGSSLTYNIIKLKPEGVLWLEPGAIVVPEGYRVVWGISTRPEEAPKFWRIKLTFKSNSSLWVRAYWNDPSNTMYEVYGKFIEKSLDIKIIDPQIHNRWTWYLENTNPYPVEIEKFEVNYIGIDKPLFQLGGLTMILGGVILAVQFPILVALNLFIIKEEND